MTAINNQLKNRLLSFAWRLGSYLAISGLAWIGNNIGDLMLPAWATTIIALITGEITKYLNKK